MENRKDTVILVHGLGGSRLDMWPIARRLTGRGLEVRNWGYRSLGNRIETHATRLGEDIKVLERRIPDGQIHMVTHSMGGIIARAMLMNFEFENLGRVVMLAPPHRGSHTARKLTPFIGWLTPSLGQLSDAADSFVNQLPNTLEEKGIEFGIVESTKDRVIAQGGVHLDGYHDYARVNGHHGILSWYPKTISLVEDFLTRGKFDVSGESKKKSRLVETS